MDDKLTRKSQEALSAAIRQAASDGNPQVEPVHLLLALLKQADGTAQPLLEAAGADMDRVLAEATAVQRKLPQTRGATASAPEMLFEATMVRSDSTTNSGTAMPGTPAKPVTPVASTTRLAAAPMVHAARSSGSAPRRITMRLLTNVVVIMPIMLTPNRKP